MDYDNDGWLDLVVVNGHVCPQVERAGLAARYAQRTLLYHNNQTSTAGPALSEPSVSRGSATGDLDNDGRLDVVINNLDGAPTVLRNDGGNHRNFLVVDLEGRAVIAAPSGPSSSSALAISRSVQSGAPATATCRTATRGCTSDAGREQRSTRSRSDGRRRHPTVP